MTKQLDWKIYLQKKAISLQDFVDDHKIRDSSSLRMTLSKMGVTCPLDIDQRVKELKWYVDTGRKYDDIIVVKTRGPVNNG